jgi:hypothetical protein
MAIAMVVGVVRYVVVAIGRRSLSAVALEPEEGTLVADIWIDGISSVSKSDGGGILGTGLLLVILQDQCRVSLHEHRERHLKLKKRTHIRKVVVKTAYECEDERFTADQLAGVHKSISEGPELGAIVSDSHASL